MRCNREQIGARCYSPDVFREDLRSIRFAAPADKAVILQFVGLAVSCLRVGDHSEPLGETFNWVDRVSINLTTQMLASLFNFPFAQREKLTFWSDMAAATPEITGGNVAEEDRLVAMQDCLQTFTALWHQRKAEGDSAMDLISLLQRDPNTADMVERPMEYLGNILLLIIGGNDTTRNSASGGVLALNENPAEYDKLRANVSFIPSMVSEVIRWQTSLMHMRRTARVDTEFQGKQIRKGDKVVMWYLSGNRDESAIHHADAFIIDRKNPRHHVSFGFGVIAVWAIVSLKCSCASSGKRS